MRISDWSSDVCSSDLIRPRALGSPLDIGRHAERVSAKPEFSPILMLGNDRQAIVAILRIIPEAKIVQLIDLPQPCPRRESEVQPRLTALMSRSAGLKSRLRHIEC